jgi:hypothetical protein
LGLWEIEALLTIEDCYHYAAFRQHRTSRFWRPQVMRTVKLVMTLGCLSVAAIAQETVDPLESCVHEADSKRRLACFDLEMRRRHEIADAVATTKHAEVGVADVIGPKLPVPAAQAGLENSAVTIAATITKLVPRSGQLYYFELDNGEVWGQTEARHDLDVRPHDGVTITHGAMGGFFLVTHDRQSIRVFRVR